jgi:hypothetical protein
MEPRARRRMRRAHQARSFGLAVVSATILATGSFAATLPATQAIAVSHIDAGAGFRSLSSADSLEVSDSIAAIGAMTAGVPLAAWSVLSVRNTALRTLELHVAVSGAPGLMAEVSPAVLKPGETAEVFISGTVEKLGALRGQISITALDGFVRRKVSLTGEVKAPAAAAPAPAVPIPTPAEPIPTPAEPIPTPAEPIPTPAEPIPTPAEPIPTPAEPIPTPAEPIPAPIITIPPAGPIQRPVIRPTPLPIVTQPATQVQYRQEGSK